jgi:septal ring-binding cell division protein DamX
MGDLAKRRAARDLWISRGHLKAALVGAFLLSGVSFGVGYVLGTGQSDAPVVRAAGFTAQVPGEDLVELLARVEANRSPDGAVSALTFPDSLAGATPEQGPLAPVMGADEAPVAYVSEAAAAPAVDEPPNGAYTLRVAEVATVEAARTLAGDLQVDGVLPWVGAEIRDGALRYTVSLGGFASERAAEAALAELPLNDDLRGATVVELP